MDSFVKYQYQGHSWMIQTSYIYFMWCVQTLGSHNFRVPHPFLSQTCLRLAGFRARFLALWSSKRTRSLSFSTKALPEWYTPLLYIPCDVCKHLEDIIEVSLICIYSQMYLRVGISEQDFRLSGVVNGLVREVSVPRTFLNDTNILYIFHVMCANTWEP